MKRVKAWIPAFAGMTTLAVSFSVSPSFASDKNAGTSGAQFLKIGAGARPTGMGDAFVGIADDVDAVYFNPAGLAHVERPELTAMHAQWFQGANYDYGAFALPSASGVFGFSAITLKVDDLEKRDANEASDGTFTSLDAAYGLSYGRKVTEGLSLGVTARYIRQEIDSASAGGWSGDVGILNRMNQGPLTVGMAVRHIGPHIKFDETGDPLPLTIDVGIGRHLIHDRLLLGFDVKKPRDNGIQYGLGSEWKQKIGKDFRFMARTGYNSVGTDAGGTTGFSLGGGIGFRQFDMDFAWVPFGDLGNTMRYAAHMRF